MVCCGRETQSVSHWSRVQTPWPFFFWHVTRNDKGLCGQVVSLGLVWLSLVF